MRNTGPTAAIRQRVVERDRHRCRRCGRVGAQIHHRIGRGAGGTRRLIVNDLSALVWLCLTCHQQITENPTLAYETGWAIRRSSKELPSEVPLTDLSGSQFFLTEEGEVIDLRQVRGRSTGEGGVGRAISEDASPHTAEDR